MSTPSFWKTDTGTVTRLAESIQHGHAETLCFSPGGRPVTAFYYGERQDLQSRANYSSACGAHDRNCYAQIQGKKPVIILLGAVHGGETEGTAALINLISLLETGMDLKGEMHVELAKLAEEVRLVIVPVCNPDGRDRVRPSSMIGCTNRELRYWMQGTWKNGSLCGWPECKKQHPIKGYVDFLGGYYNDDGINLMHDNFFHPMAAETQAIMDLCDREHADWILQLHGGSNAVNDLLQTNYATLECQRAIRVLSERCNDAAVKFDLHFNIRDLPQKEQGNTPPSFNLASALHHVCGGVSAVFESNQCIIDDPGPHLTHEQIYISHLILMEQCFHLALKS